MSDKIKTGFPSIDNPWQQYYPQSVDVYGLPSPDCGIDSFLRSCSKKRMDATALDYFGRKISFRRMFENVDAVAFALLSSGVKPGDIVSICPLNTPEFVYLLYAVNKVGAVSNWISPTATVDDIRTELSSTGSKLLFVVEMAAGKLAQACEGTGIEKLVSVPIYCSMPAAMRLLLKLKNKVKPAKAEPWQKFMGRAGNSCATELSVAGSDTAVIEYTGGSTGVPKGVMLTNTNMNSYLIGFYGANRAGITDYHPGRGFLASVPLFLGFGVSSGCHGPMCHGMYLVLAPDPNPESLGKLVLNRKPNYIVSGRVQIDGIVDAAKRHGTDLSFIHSVMYGGEAINKPWAGAIEEVLLAHNSSARVLNGYGMTETAAAILLESAGTSGGMLPLTGVIAKVTDPDTGEELPNDTDGELCLCSPTVMKGYFHQGAQIDSPLSEENGNRWLRTGDLAKISEDGTIHIVGRIKRIYHKIYDGIDARVYPVRIEETLTGFETIEKCAVIGVKDEKTAFRTIAYIKLRDIISEASVKAEIIEHCKKNLPANHIPDEFIFCTDFPLTRAGKVDYLALEKEFETSSTK